MPVGLQAVQGCLDPRIQLRVDRDVLPVMVKQAGIILLLGPWGQQQVGTHPPVSRPQHCPAAVERGQRIRHRVQHHVDAARRKAGIRRRDQVGRCIGQRAVQIKDHRSRHAQSFPQRFDTKGERAGLSQARGPD